jgi:hypothetical protein
MAMLAVRLRTTLLMAGAISGQPLMPLRAAVNWIADPSQFQ